MEHYGGQAVIEGVMMKSSKNIAIAVRMPDGKIKIKKENLAKRKKWIRAPFIRGITMLVEMLIIGIKALIWSADQQLGKEEKISKKEVTLTIILSMLFAVGIFVVLPFFLTGFIVKQGFWFNLIDGLIRVAIFVLYILIISLFSDVKTLFQYHGAEHKAVNAYESEKKMDYKTVRKYTTLHPRCGTMFIFIVLLLSIILFSLIIWDQWYIRLGSRIVLIPVIASISYELLKLGDKHRDNIFLKIMTYPGLLLQKITTREPSKKQIEVAVKALQAVVK